MHAAKCLLDLNRNDLADSLDFDMNLKTNPADMIQIGAYTKQSHTWALLKIKEPDLEQ